MTAYSADVLLPTGTQHTTVRTRDELLADVRAAYRFVQSQPEVDPKRVVPARA
jgi:dienelactone hydrolase